MSNVKEFHEFTDNTYYPKVLFLRYEKYPERNSFRVAQKVVIKMKLRLRLRIFDEIEIWIPLIAKLTVSCEKSQDENNNNKMNYRLGHCQYYSG